jgi:hypothetical protein
MAVLALLGACGRVDAVSGDGVLDCSAGQVSRGLPINVSAVTELEVAGEALAQWIADGGSLHEAPDKEVWYVTRGGLDVAVATPEQNGSGEWVVVGVQVCGEPETGPAPIDGELDCADETSWVIQGGFDPSVPGLPTAEEALRSILEPYAERHGGDIVLVEATIGSLVVEQREQVVARASEVPAGGWSVDTVVGCTGFE